MSNPTAHVPNSNETWLDQIHKGEAAILPNAPHKTIIPAQLFREHILETNSDVSSDNRRRAVRWEIHNAIFVEQLNLQDGCRPGGGSLPAVEFVNCEFKDGFCADGARLERVKFKNCLFVAEETAEMADSNGLDKEELRLAARTKTSGEKKQIFEAGTPEGAAQSDVKHAAVEQRHQGKVRNRISLRNCRIETELWLEGLAPHAFDGKRGILIVDAFAVRVGTNVIVRNTTLRAPLGESSATLSEVNYALDLSTAEVGSDVQLTPGVILHGGLKMRDARVGGSFWGAGLNATDGEDALSREALKKRQSTPRKSIDFESTRIQGNLRLDFDDDDLRQRAKGYRHRLREHRGATEEEEFSYDKDVMPFLFRSTGKVSISNAAVGGDLYLSPGKIFDDLEMSNLTVRGSIKTKELDLNGTWFLEIQRKIPNPPLSVDGFVCLDNCHIGGDCTLHIRARTIRVRGGVLSGNATFKGYITSFEAEGVNVSGDFEIACTQMIGCFLPGAKVGGALNFTHAEFREFKPTALAMLTKELSCFPSFHLTEVLVPLIGKGGEERKGIIAFLTTSQKPKKGVLYKPILLDGGLAQLVGLMDGDRTVINRDGSEEPIHNDFPNLSLNNEEEAREYFKLLCAFVWRYMGSFSILTDQQDLPKGIDPNPELLNVPCTRIVRDQKTLWELRAYMRYSIFAYQAVFHLDGEGFLEKVKDDLIGEYADTDAEKLSTFDPPYRYPLKPLALDAYRSDFQGWKNLSSSNKTISAFENEAGPWRKLLWQQATIDLRGASCKMLKDSGAQVWTHTIYASDITNKTDRTHKADLILELEEFDYLTFEGDKDLETRLKWIRSGIAGPESPGEAAGLFLLTLVGGLFLLLVPFGLALYWAQRTTGLSDPSPYLGFRFLLIFLFSVALVLAGLWFRYRRHLRETESKSKFKAQPYAHLAQVFRKRGDDDAAREVEAEKMWQEAVERSRSSFLATLWKIVWWRPYGVMFNYGLSPLRAAISILAIWLLGWGCVSVLSENQMLQANVTKVAAAFERQQGVMIVPAGTQGVSNIPCGDAVEPGLYAFELVTPILNLHQESRCAITSKLKGENFLMIRKKKLFVPSLFTNAAVWEYGEALYMLAGTIITSLALLTFSGIARRWEH